MLFASVQATACTEANSLESRFRVGRGFALSLQKSARL